MSQSAVQLLKVDFPLLRDGASGTCISVCSSSLPTPLLSDTPLHIAGPIPIPQEVIELWSSVREPQAAPNSKDGEENESESQDGNDDNDDDNYDNDDDDDANGDENDHSGEEMRVDVPEEEAGDVDSRKNHSAIGNVASHAKHHRRSQRVISGASTATSASQATSVGQKRGRSVTPEGSAAGRSPPRKQIRKAKGM